MEFTVAYIFQIIFACFMTLITLYLIILYIKGKSFHTYSCYNIIFMSIVILLECILQFVPSGFGDDGQYEGFEFIIGFLRNFFAKLIMLILSLQVIVLYIGIIHTDYYYTHEKSIFIIGTIVSLIASGVLGGIYASIRWVKNKDGIYIYDEKDENDDNDENQDIKVRKKAKQIIEIVFSSILLIANVFCLIVVISHISKKSQQAKAGLIEDLGYKKQLIKFLFIFFVNIIAIVVSAVIMNFNILREYNELLYLIVCFIIDLCFSINRTIYKETLYIFCKKDVDEDERLKILKKNSTFGYDINSDINEDDDE